jgi:tetratricopeptide (TPR) repeat protein
VFAAPPTVVQPVPAPKPPSAPEPEPISLGDVARARRQAERLTRESRFDEAARMLTRIAEKAGPLLGAEHSDVIGLRIDLANVLFTGGDYAKAAVAFQHLSQDLARRDGPDTDLVLRFRFQEATCHAALGDGELALRQLERLLSDEVRVYGPEDGRVAELRKQIALLQHGIGHTTEAVQGLEQLAADLERRHGPKHSDVQEIREAISRMK